MDEIRVLTINEIYQYTRNNQLAYPTFYKGSKDELETMIKRQKEILETSSDLTPIGYFKDGNLAGNMLLVDFRMNYSGEILPIGGISALAVHPAYKKQGIARSLIQYGLKWSKDKNHLFSILYPFNHKFYKNFNYGFTIPQYHYSFHPKDIIIGTDLTNIKWIEDKDRERILKFHNEYCLETAGAVFKSTIDRRRILTPEVLNGVIYEVKDEIKGYLIYDASNIDADRLLSQKMRVNEFVYKDGLALHGLLSFIKSQSDQFERVDLFSYDSKFNVFLDDISYSKGAKLLLPISHKVAEVGLGLMVQVLDPKKVIEMICVDAFNLEVKSNKEESETYEINGGGELVVIQKGLLSSVLFGSIDINELIDKGLIDKPKVRIDLFVNKVRCNSIF